MIYKLRLFDPKREFIIFCEEEFPEGQYTVNVKKIGNYHTGKKSTIIEMIQKIFPDSHSFSKRYILDFLK